MYEVALLSSDSEDKQLAAQRYIEMLAPSADAVPHRMLHLQQSMILENLEKESQGMMEHLERHLLRRKGVE